MTAPDRFTSALFPWPYIGPMHAWFRHLPHLFSIVNQMCLFASYAKDNCRPISLFDFAVDTLYCWYTCIYIFCEFSYSVERILPAKLCFIHFRHIVQVRAQVMFWDNSTGLWGRSSGGGISNVCLFKVVSTDTNGATTNPTESFYIHAQRISDKNVGFEFFFLSGMLCLSGLIWLYAITFKWEYDNFDRASGIKIFKISFNNGHTFLMTNIWCNLNVTNLMLSCDLF